MATSVQISLIQQLVRSRERKGEHAPNHNNHFRRRENGRKSKHLSPLPLHVDPHPHVSSMKFSPITSRAKGASYLFICISQGHDYRRFAPKRQSRHRGDTKNQTEPNNANSTVMLSMASSISMPFSKVTVTIGTRHCD